ncbi:MAG: hypothetical protein LBJ64_00170 [Deltaproteobacteria bacterium]|jgi:hypothetical protein|nr:hypothetical protein [Deltaproteobacteria bacterium]
MIKIQRIWVNVDEQNNVTLLRRPRVSIKVDELVWSVIERNIAAPKKIMQSGKHDYMLVVGLKKYSPETCKFFPASPYNGQLKENAKLDAYRNPSKCYSCEDFVGGKERTTWFFTDSFWMNAGHKTLNVSADAANVDENITPVEYADLLFDAFGAALTRNFKKLRKEDFDALKPSLDEKAIAAFPFPAPFEQQQYLSDEGGFKTTIRDGQAETTLIDIPSIREYYQRHFGES